ncbi:MAG: hypothetical protein ACKOET_14170, partial [Verrucomicrobiota bacterium]
MHLIRKTGRPERCLPRWGASFLLLVWVAVWGVGVFPEWHHCFHVHRLADPPVESSGLEVAAGLPLPDPDDSGDADPDTCLLCQIQRGQAWYPAVTPDHVPVQL